MNKKIIVTVIVIIITTLIVFFWLPFKQKMHPEKQIHIIGIAGWNSYCTYKENIRGFKDGLAEKGYVEGQNVRFIIKTSESDLKIQRQIIESFVSEKVDLIYSLTTPGTLVAKDVTKKIPIVFSIVTYPVESGVIEALESSGNNLVGTRNFITVKKQYNQFEKIYPDTKTLAFVHRKNESNSVIQYNDIRKLLDYKSIKVIDIAAVDLDDMRTQLESNINDIDSLFLACDTLINVGGDEVVIEISKKYKKPNFACLKDSVVKGALIGNVADFYTIGKISGNKAGLILQGANSSSLLTESPFNDYVIINTKTAAEIGTEIPQYVLDDAEEIVSK